LLKIEKLPNLYRLLRPGDKPNKPTGAYYALIGSGRKQFVSLPASFRRLIQKIEARGIHAASRSNSPKAP